MSGPERRPNGERDKRPSERKAGAAEAERERDAARDERELARLFDRTSVEPSAAQLQRAARAAAQIPGQRRSLWLRLRYPRPLEIGLAVVLGAAAAAGALWFATRPSGRDPYARVDTGSDDESWGPLLAELDDADLDDDGDDTLEPDVLGLDDPLAALVGLSDDGDALDLLHAPAEGVDLASWATAYDALLEER